MCSFCGIDVCQRCYQELLDDTTGRPKARCHPLGVFIPISYLGQSEVAAAIDSMKAIISGYANAGAQCSSEGIRMPAIAA